MRSSGQIGGTGHPIKRVLWVFFATCVAVAIFGHIHNISDLSIRLHEWSSQLQTAVTHLTHWLGLSNGPKPPTWAPKGTYGIKHH